MQKAALIPFVLALLVPVGLVGADAYAEEDRQWQPGQLRDKLGDSDREEVREKIKERIEADRWWEEDRETGNWKEKFDFRGKLGGVDFDKPWGERVRNNTTVEPVLTEKDVQALRAKIMEVMLGERTDRFHMLMDRLLEHIPIVGTGGSDGKILIGVDPSITFDHLNKLKNVLKEQWGGIVEFSIGRVGYIEPLSGTAGAATAQAAQSTGTPIVMTNNTDLPIPDVTSDNRIPEPYLAADLSNNTDLPIPDGTSDNRVFIPFTVTKNGTIADVSVSVDIKHTYIGDLSVSLLSPKGSEPLLHYRTGGGTDNLTKTYTMARTPYMSDHLPGINMTGTWKIVVTDWAPNDTGYVDSVSLTLTPVATSPPPAPAPAPAPPP